MKYQAVIVFIIWHNGVISANITYLFSEQNVEAAGKTKVKISKLNAAKGVRNSNNSCSLN